MCNGLLVIYCRPKFVSYLVRWWHIHEKTGTVIRPVQAVSEDIFIRTVRPRRIVNCLTVPPRNILTYLLTYLLCSKYQTAVSWPYLTADGLSPCTKKSWVCQCLVCWQDVLVHIRDISHPDATAQKENVLETLRQQKVDTKLLGNMIEVCNKVDKVNQRWRDPDS